jgi:hypothetical protein
VRYLRQEIGRGAGEYQSAMRLHLTEDFHESALAFMEKREPNFKGR